MKVATLIIGFVPLSDLTGKKPRELRDDKYFKDLLTNFNIGEVHYAIYQNFKEELDKVHPFIVIVFGDWYAKEVSEYKKDNWIYVTDSPSTIFSRKAEVTTKQEKQRSLFTEIASLVQRIREEPDEKEDELRKVASMTYEDTYEMLKRAIIGDREDLRQRAWALLTDNNAGSRYIWMRAQMMMEVWQHCDGKGKEEFLCMAMEQHVENGFARKMDNFIDADGQEYHQYMFTHPAGIDLNYIRRIPIGFKGQDKYAYEAILQKYETPNGLQMMLEAGQMKAKKKN